MTFYQSEWRTLIGGWVDLSRSGITKSKMRLFMVWGRASSSLLKESPISHFLNKNKETVCLDGCPWWPLHSHQGSHGMQRKAERQGSLDHTTTDVYQPSICESANSPLTAPVKLMRHFLYLLSSGSSERFHVQRSTWPVVLIDASYQDRVGRAGG